MEFYITDSVGGGRGGSVFLGEVEDERGGMKTNPFDLRETLSTITRASLTAPAFCSKKIPNSLSPTLAES